MFFLSYVLILLAPLPPLYLLTGTEDRRAGRLWALASVAIGAILLAVIKGPAGALAFVLLAGLPALVMGELLLRKAGFGLSVLGGFAAIFLGGALVLLATPSPKATIREARTAIENQVIAFNEKVLEQRPDLADAKKEEMPIPVKEATGLLGTALLLLCILPALALVRWNPKGFLRRTGLHRDFLRKWRAPDWLVWPALLCGVFFVYPIEPYSEIASNLLKPILLIYFFQGMSILSYFLDSLRLRGPIRVLIYGTGVLFLTPMVVSFGFFDLWFNFRGRGKKPLGEDKEP